MTGQRYDTIDGHDSVARIAPALGGIIELGVGDRASSTQPRSLLRWTLLGLDAAMLGLAWILVGLVEPSSLPGWVVLPHVAVGIGLMAWQRLYRARVSSLWTAETAGLLRVAAVLAFAETWLIRPEALADMTRPVLAFGATFLALGVGRAIFRESMTLARARGALLTPVVVIGRGDDASELVDIVDDAAADGFRVAGVFGPARSWAGSTAPWLGDVQDAPMIMARLGVKVAVVDGSGLSAADVTHVVHALVDDGIHVHVASSVRRLNHRRLTTRPIGRHPMQYVERASLSRSGLVCKRIMDVAGGITGLLLASPVLLAVAIAIKLEDGGPIFFSQERVGKDGRSFRIHKVRSMFVDAEDRLDELDDANFRDGPLFKVAVDPRITRVGRFIRAASIDEIPQFWNVVRGEMSLVGPRPALASEVELFDAELLERQSVKPGVTGLWQVDARDNPSFSAYRRLDLFYVQNWSLLLDLAVILGTVAHIIRRLAGGSSESGGLEAPEQHVPLVDPEPVRAHQLAS